MARKNRYEYSLLKEVYRILSTITYPTYEDRNKAQRLMAMVSEFLDKENVELSMTQTRPRFSERVGASQWMVDPNSYVSAAPVNYHVFNPNLTQASRVTETEGESPF